MKKNSITFFFITIVVCLLFSCVSRSDRNNESESSDNSYYSEEDDENVDNNSGCKYEDGTYSATVAYHNPETGYSATYTLNVEVEDCQVVQINFPNDGYLDNDHITYDDIDEDGTASVTGEGGKTYEIQIFE